MQMLEKYFDTAFDAPDGIKKLRELILTLAMQGKLVPQDPNDQPASELLKEIEKEKEQLVKEGKIKKSKLISNDGKYKFNFDLPMGWSWTKLGTLCILENGDRGKNYPNQSALVPEGIPFINAGHLQNTKINLKNMNYITENRFELLSSGKVQKNDILFCLRGSLGKVALVDNIEQGAIASSLVIVRLFQNFIFQEYVLNYFMSNLSYLMVKMHDNGTAQPNLSATDLSKFEIPLPPLNEQKRIVEKINQLMALCDELEKLKEQKELKKLTVHKSAINQLLDSKDDSNSQKGWHFISEHFNDIYTVKENVSELRSTILQLAMQGKLVPQDPNDQPASELLKKLKKTKNIPEVNSNEMSFSLPQSWKWERIVNLGVTQTGTTPPKKDPDNYGDFIPFIGPGNIKNGIIDYSGEGLSEKGIEKGRLIEKDSILMVCIGGSIGKHAMTNQDISCNQQINTITVYPELSTQYVYWAMASQYFQNTVINQAGGSATPIINKLKWSSIPIPVPPHSEQQRIVEKINQLMALCDDLEKQIENSSSKQTQLLNAIMSNLGK
ncbi:restriction endonuclease subunit S [Aliarcobacter butzleri]|uniref:restriction endonuclease subunit S n=1 Tax=Aliarcobacter butzleri TaxID=28197 RepID=UPI001EDB9992|nr:restriction endonuclease subunit S [Aliarcobacter butzleri]MCG3693689.1 restriction endonuclease subunit S [Aliarcobacter butzleri]